MIQVVSVMTKMIPLIAKRLIVVSPYSTYCTNDAQVIIKEFFCQEKTLMFHVQSLSALSVVRNTACSGHRTEDHVCA
jgi:uncharacterized membrane protein